MECGLVEGGGGGDGGLKGLVPYEGSESSGNTTNGPVEGVDDVECDVVGE